MPERKPEVAMDFEAASFTNEQASQDEDHIRDLKSQRAYPEPQGMDYTIGGSVEQAAHGNVIDEREVEINRLQERIDRQRQRGREI